MPSLFYKLGLLAGPKVRKGRWMWESLTGGERDVVEAERRVGRDMHDAMAGQLGVDGDAAVRAEVESIGAALGACVRDKRRSFQFTVAAGGEPNAFALPGGFVFITRALLELLGRERNAVAFVLGHEVGHVVKQHPMNRLFSDTALSAAARVVPGPAGLAGQWVKNAGLQLMRSAYSRDNELLADKLGARFAQAAGFDPRGGPRMLAALRSLHADQPAIPLAEYFATHPALETRIAELERYLTKNAG